jgi:hypothetical protein
MSDRSSYFCIRSLCKQKIVRPNIAKHCKRIGLHNTNSEAYLNIAYNDVQLILLDKMASVYEKKDREK